MTGNRCSHREIGVAKLSLWATLPVSALFLGTCGADIASASTMTYTGYSVQYEENIHITSPNNISGGAGQITLTGVTGNSGLPSTVLAWCVDIFHFLQGSGTYTVEVPQSPPLPLTITNAQKQEMGGLMLEGNTLLAGSVTTFNGHSYTKSDISAATQVAIWSIEYGGLGYSITSITSPYFADLVTYLESHATNADWVLLDGGSGNQSLGTVTQGAGNVPVPGPLAGAGFPGVALAGLGLLWWRRRATKGSSALAAV